MILTCESVDQAVFSSMLEGKITVVTSGARLANYFRQQIEAVALNENINVCVSPDVIPWPHWILKLWEEAIVTESVEAQGQVLTSIQQELLWEKIVSVSESGKTLLQANRVAKDAMETWRLLRSWEIESSEVGFSYNDDSRAFGDWTRRFEEECARKGWIQAEVLPDLLSAAVTSERFSILNSLLLTGFDEFTPQQLSFIKALQNSGTNVRWIKVEEESSSVFRVTCADAHEETRLVAQWARQRLEAREDAKIGIVVPELSSMRARVLNSLDEVLLPSKWAPNFSQPASIYNVSLGLPLKNYPVIQSALLLLEFISDPLSLNDIGLVLRSPYISGWESEQDARAMLDEKLRKEGEMVISLDILKSFSDQAERSYSCPIFSCLLSEISEQRIQLNKQMSTSLLSPSAWAEYFSVWLKIAGWTQGRTLNSEEYQATEAFKDVISTLGSLDAIYDSFSGKEAVSRLGQLTMERIFQPETEDAPVQVLGILEVAGLSFDHVWVMGLHEDSWPPSPYPTPFLPLPMQRSQDLPRSSSERELRIAKLVMQRLFKSGKEVMVSYPANKGEERLQCSPLILEIPEIGYSDLEVWKGNTWREQIFQSRVLETLDNDPAPPVVANNFRGGSKVFKHQAACPFRAFAEIRLGASALKSASIGLLPTTRGNLIHQALELVWGKLESWDSLNRLSDSKLQQLVVTCIDSVLKAAAGKYPTTFTMRFHELEKERLTQLIMEWLESEKQRIPFRVTGKEKKFTASVGGVNVDLQIDRIDELPDGTQILIDYKTGSVSPAKWFGERPEEPQLPLYTAVVGGKVGAIAFGSLKQGDVGFYGITSADGMLPEVKSFDQCRYVKDIGSWEQLLDDWKLTLEQLGKDFCAGHAIVDPKKESVTCQYCELQPLCRIYETSVLDGTEGA